MFSKIQLTIPASNNLFSKKTINYSVPKYKTYLKPYFTNSKMDFSHCNFFKVFPNFHNNVYLSQKIPSLIRFYSNKNNNEFINASFKKLRIEFKTLLARCSQTFNDEDFNSPIFDDFLEIQLKSYQLLTSFEFLTTRLHEAYSRWSHINFNIDRVFYVICELATDLSSVIKSREELILKINRYNIKYAESKTTLDKLLSCIMKLEVKVVCLELNLFQCVKLVLDFYSEKNDELNSLFKEVKKVIEKLNKERSSDHTNLSEIFHELHYIISNILLFLSDSPPNIEEAMQEMKKMRSVLQLLLV